jgi:hypothetical protein
LTLSLEKTLISKHDESILYLGFYWDKYNRPDQTDLWWIAKVVTPERYVDAKGWGRILNRITSIIFQIKRGPKIFYKLANYELKWLRTDIRRRSKVIVHFWTPISGLNMESLPLDILLTKGWRTF